MKLKVTIILMFCFIGINVNAMSSTAEINCTNQSVVFHNGVVVLNPQNKAGPHVYLFKNIAGQVLQLNHSTGMGMQAGWASNLDPQRISAVLIQKNSFFFSCAYLNSDGFPDTVNCQNVIATCEMKNIIYPDDPSMLQGQYWITENQTVNTLNNVLMQRGFVPK